MPGIFQSLDIARRAIWANRLGLDVASHNIANANTPGYSRQRVDLSAARPLQLMQGQLGMGVEATQITRIRNQLLDVQYRQASHSLGKEQIKEELFYQIETIVQEPTENSIGNLMTEFFSEFSSLGAEPENSNIRNVLLQKAVSLAETFNQKSARLTETQTSLRRDIQNTVTEINQMTSQIADLNRQIMVAEGAFGTANDLRDQRDVLLDKLAEKMDIRYVEDSRGSVNVTAAGQALVSGTSPRELSLESQGDGGKVSVTIKGSSGQDIAVESGALGGLLELHNNSIPNLLDKLNKLAKNFIENVNHVHQSGYGLATGNPPTSATGLNFFIGSDAGSIRVAPPILEDVSNIAASIDGSSGNGEVAFAISNLRDNKMMSNGSQTLDEFYNDTITNLGTDIELARSKRENQEMLRDQIQNQRTAVSGVSLDEEMANLIKFQRSLEASAKVIRVVDEILETVINM